MLTNITYTGKLRYKDEVHDGEHDAIVSAELWQQVQTLLSRNGRTGGSAGGYERLAEVIADRMEVIEPAWDRDWVRLAEVELAAAARGRHEQQGRMAVDLGASDRPR